MTSDNQLGGNRSTMVVIHLIRDDAVDEEIHAGGRKLTA